MSLRVVIRWRSTQRLGIRALVFQVAQSALAGRGAATFAGFRDAAENDDTPMTRCGTSASEDSLKAVPTSTTDALSRNNRGVLHWLDNLAAPFVCVVVAQGVVAFVLRGSYTNVTVCGFVFFLLLMLNTYVSLTFTDSVYHVRCLSDGVINLPLVAAYFALPWLVHRPFWFFFVKRDLSDQFFI